MIRIFFGGSFDPVHTGHLDMVRCVAHRLSLQSSPFVIYFLPTAGNPFKGKATDPNHRLAMLSLARTLLADETIDVEVCPLEIQKTPPVYTIDTVRTLAQHYPNDERIFIMGGDSLSSLHLWKDYEAILTHIKIWAFARADHDHAVHPKILAKITQDFDEFITSSDRIFYDNTPIRAISSTQIRQALQNNHEPTQLPKPILDYIKRYTLYKSVL